MAKFTDSEGREWDVRLTVGDLPALREAGFDLGKVFGAPDGWAQGVGSDPAVVVKALYPLCERRVKELDMTPEQFGQLFDPDTYGRATEALLAEAAGFFPNSRAAKVIRTRAGDVFGAMEQAANGELDRLLSTWRTSATGSPGSSGLTPGP